MKCTLDLFDDADEARKRATKEAGIPLAIEIIHDGKPAGWLGVGRLRKDGRDWLGANGQVYTDQDVAAFDDEWGM